MHKELQRLLNKILILRHCRGSIELGNSHVVYLKARIPGVCYETLSPSRLITRSKCSHSLYKQFEQWEFCYSAVQISCRQMPDIFDTRLYRSLQSLTRNSAVNLAGKTYRLSAAISCSDLFSGPINEYVLWKSCPLVRIFHVGSSDGTR
jgi:hypothetical protein